MNATASIHQIHRNFAKRSRQRALGKYMYLALSQVVGLSGARIIAHMVDGTLPRPAKIQGFGFEQDSAS